MNRKRSWKTSQKVLIVYAALCLVGLIITLLAVFL